MNVEHQLIIDSCASASDKLLSLSYSMPALSANSFGLFILGIPNSIEIFLCPYFFYKFLLNASRLLTQIFIIFLKSILVLDDPVFIQGARCCKNASFFNLHDISDDSSKNTNALKNYFNFCG